MAVALVGPPARGAGSHPAFEPLRPWLGQLQAWPDVTRLNELAAASPRPPVTDSGQLVRFSAPEGSGAAQYERRILETGLVSTRPGNLHDMFNALAWIAFPRLKAAINARHVARLPDEGRVRSPLRDLLTLVDEGGVIVACAGASQVWVEDMVRGFHWQSLFWDRRTELLRDTRFVLVGHSAYEKALAPYAGITCKALFLQIPRPIFDLWDANLAGWLDESAAAWVRALPDDARPRQMPPLPVFGYPGWLPGSAMPELYADRRWFRTGPSERLITQPNSV